MQSFTNLSYPIVNRSYTIACRHPGIPFSDGVQDRQRQRKHENVLSAIALSVLEFIGIVPLNSYEEILINLKGPIPVFFNRL